MTGLHKVNVAENLALFFQKQDHIVPIAFIACLERFGKIRRQRLLGFGQFGIMVLFWLKWGAFEARTSAWI